MHRRPSPSPLASASAEAASSLLSVRWPALRDVVKLAKPGITTMSVLTAAGAMAIGVFVGSPSGAAGAVTTLVDAVLVLVGIACSVAGAGALNQWWERSLDARMSRTRDRPLPSGRMDPLAALALGLLWSALAVPLLLVGGPLTAALNAVALVLYVAVYTPMKQRSALAVVVGAVPGAMPALLGYVGVRGVVDEIGLVLFGIVFLWQLPHFLAIALYRHKEYAKAGYVVTPSVVGDAWTRTLIVASALPLVAVSLMLCPLGVAGVIYGGTAGLLGVWFLVLCARGYVHGDGAAWGRKVFFASLVYQTVLFSALGLDVAIAVMWR